MSPYKLTFKLKQHTPIIHFQHDQHGATLRASELKPKLDKFILMKLGKEEDTSLERDDEIYTKGYEVAKAKKWLMGNSVHSALNYSVKIIDKDNNRKSGSVNVMPSTAEKWVLSSAITFNLFSHISEIKNIIEDEINLFFAKMNFGKRQNKGFGCFYPSNLKEEEFVDLLKSNNIVLYKKQNRPLRNEVQTDNYFYERIITPNWGRLKSGKNHNGYEKSSIFEYLCANQLRWDKRWIKRKLKELINNGTLPADLKGNNDPIDCDNANNWKDTTDEEYRFGRAMLGLAEHYEFRALNGYTYQVKVMNDSIERFKSPITFKVFHHNIYAFAEAIDAQMFDKSFSFEIIKKRNNVLEDSPLIISGNLFTPTESEFNLDVFLNDYFETVGFKRV